MDLHPCLQGFALDFVYFLFLLGYILPSCRHVAFIRFYVHQGENARCSTYVRICLFSTVKINKPSFLFLFLFSIPVAFVVVMWYLGTVLKVRSRNRTV